MLKQRGIICHLINKDESFRCPMSFQESSLYWFQDEETSEAHLLKNGPSMTKGDKEVAKGVMRNHFSFHHKDDYGIQCNECCTSQVFEQILSLCVPWLENNWDSPSISLGRSQAKATRLNVSTSWLASQQKQPWIWEHLRVHKTQEGTMRIKRRCFIKRAWT